MSCSELSQQVLHQRLRNRAIDVIETCASLEAAADFGAFNTMNSVDDWLPLPEHQAPKVFSSEERAAVDKFLEAFNLLADATPNDSHDITWFRTSPEWQSLAHSADQAIKVFAKRGRFSEETQDPRFIT